MTNISIYLQHRKITFMGIKTTLLSDRESNARNVPFITIDYQSNKDAHIDTVHLSFNKKQFEKYKKMINDYEYKFEDVLKEIHKPIQVRMNEKKKEGDECR